MDDLVTVEEAAEILGVTALAVYQRHHRGTFAPPMTEKRPWRFRRGDVVALLPAPCLRCGGARIVGGWPCPECKWGIKFQGRRGGFCDSEGCLSFFGHGGEHVVPPAHLGQWFGFLREQGLEWLRLAGWEIVRP